MITKPTNCVSELQQRPSSNKCFLSAKKKSAETGDDVIRGKEGKVCHAVRVSKS